MPSGMRPLLRISRTVLTRRENGPGMDCGTCRVARLNGSPRDQARTGELRALYPDRNRGVDGPRCDSRDIRIERGRMTDREKVILIGYKVMGWKLRNGQWMVLEDGELAIAAYEDWNPLKSHRRRFRSGFSSEG